MDIKQLILAKLRKKGQLEASEIIKETGFTRARVNDFFRELLNEGKIVRFGKTKGAFYVLAEKKLVDAAKSKILVFHKILENINLKEDVILDQIKKETGIFKDLKENVLHIVEYAFTEMLNNAIDHSQSEKIIVEIKRSNVDISFSVNDHGVGVFNNIKEKRHLPDAMTAIENLLKGKTTTAPEQHSGEGIFFTSRIADTFVLQSFGKKMFFHNILHDIFLQDTKISSGTQVFFTVALDADKTLKELFDKYTDVQSETYEFNKTEVIVKLFQFGDNMISRSQAKRVVEGLEKFDEITLDFKDVVTVGQGFADEVFRVWQDKFPRIKIKYRNANENIEFMIKRVIGK